MGRTKKKPPAPRLKHKASMPDQLRKNREKRELDRKSRQLEKLIDEIPRGEAFAKKCLRIVPKKGGKPIPFEYNSTQRKIRQVFDEERAKGKAVLLNILKPRQIGCSTITGSIMMEEMLRRKHVSGLTVSHEKESAQWLLKIHQTFYNGLTTGFKMPLQYDSRGDIEFKPPHSSKMQISTARNVGGGHSRTYQLLHGSELPGWERPDDIWDGIMNSVPLEDPNTVVIFESCSYGSGNWHEDFWKSSIKGESGFRPIFLSWLEHEEYRQPGKTWEDLGKLDAEEKKLCDEHDADAEQISWRRWCIKTRLRGRKSAFRQWYPATPEEAFRTQTRVWFDFDALKRRAEECVKPVFQGHIFGKQLVDDPDEGALKIWKPPEQGRLYLGGVDPSDGRYDPSFIAIMDRQTLDVVATYRNKVAIHDLYPVIKDLGYHYNVALINIEANVGKGLNSELQNDHYPNLFYQRRKTGLQDLVPGFWIGQAQRRELLYLVGAYVAAKPGVENCDTCKGAGVVDKVECVKCGGKGEVPSDKTRMIWDRYLIKEEMMHFIMKAISDARGQTRLLHAKIEAQSGFHDDGIFALGMCLEAERENPWSPMIGKTIPLQEPFDAIVGY